ncbi:MAG: DUF2202 domain-containing protein [Saprospiraceae bacterium]|nr:DUF2202 domain-containing protein [Saprospiraceae bacterium]
MKKSIIFLLLVLSAQGINTTFAQNCDLSKTERRQIKTMLEEEKLAREVYLDFHAKWNKPIFKNIAEAEQRHLTTLLVLARNCSIDIPGTVKNKKTGRFNKKELQHFYDKAIIDGSHSLAQALKTSAKLEEMDIHDLVKARETTENTMLIQQYDHLLAASGNHLRAFTKHLRESGLQYEPTVLPKNKYEEIINEGNEKPKCGEKKGVSCKESKSKEGCCQSKSAQTKGGKKACCKATTGS